MGFFSAWINRVRERRDARAFTQTGILRRAEENLQSGILTAEGFLGRDSRRLVRIIQEDELRFQELGLDWSAMASRLEQFMQDGSRGLGEPITIAGGFLVQVAETRGRFACPWEDGLFLKRSATVRRIDGNGQPTGPQLLFSDLSVHLLKEHHFLQGKGSPFRLEPEVLKNFAES